MKLHAKSPLDGSWRGRPVAAVAICRRTLMVAGVHVTYNHFGTLELMECLADAFLPRDAAEYGTENWWPCEGVADRVFVLTLPHSNDASFRRFRQSVGFELAQVDSLGPLVSDIADRWSEESGVEVDSIGDGRSAEALWDKGFKPKGVEQVLVADVERNLRRWVIDRYNATPIPGIERSPLDLWEESTVGFVPRFVPPEAPGDYFRREMFRPIGPYGLVWKGRTYWCDDFSKWYDRRGEGAMAEPG